MVDFLSNPCKEPASVILANEFFKYVRNKYPEYGLDYDRLIKCAKQQDYQEFCRVANDEVDKNISNIYKIFEKIHHNDKQMLVADTENVCNSIDAIYSYINYPKFVYRSDSETLIELLLSDANTDNLQSYDFLDYFEKIDDMIVNFQLKSGYANFMMRICKPDYLVDCKKGNNLTPLVVVFLFNDNGKSRIVGQMTIAKELYPSVFLDPTCTIYNCNPTSCKRCVESSLVSHNDSYKLEKTFCYMTKKKLDEGACIMGSFNIHKLLNISAYVWDSYTHRHSLVRKNSKRKSTYEKHQVSIVSNDDYSVLPLHNYYKYEREHKDWQGGHHQSPVKHERRSHERRIYNKDGTLKKVVTVRQCTVNPDGRQGIYKINEPRRG